jgi:5-amino-6-(5-phosphoribosylamino)uracil reductase
VAIAAMSVDGKIADRGGSPARFASAVDKSHLETQIAQLDAVMFGANTLRAYGTSLVIRAPELLQQRQQAGKPAQPIHIVCSRSGAIAQDLAFFRQPLPRWLMSSAEGGNPWRDRQHFEQIIELDAGDAWQEILTSLSAQNIQHLGILGGGELIASFAEQRLIDELWLTLCPILLGGKDAPTLMAGEGFWESQGLRLELIESQVIASEIFVHYRVCD